MIFNGMMIDDSRLLDWVAVTNIPGGTESSETLEWALEEISYDEGTSRSDLWFPDMNLDEETIPTPNDMSVLY